MLKLIGVVLLVLGCASGFAMDMVYAIPVSILLGSIAGHLIVRKD